MGRKVDQQILLRNVAVQACGLSQQGRGLLSDLDVILSETSFRRKQAEFLQQRENILK